MIIATVRNIKELPTYPSPKPTFFPKREVGVKCWLRGGVGGQFPETYDDLKLLCIALNLP